MKRDTRTQIVISKPLPNGIIESFYCWVLNNDVQQIARDYKGRGYSVDIKE